MTQEQTPRQQLKELLPNGEFSLKELADLLDEPVKRVLNDLEHVRTSEGDRFQIIPCRCRSCGFEFSDRTRLDRPSRCPACREERVEGPWFSME